MAQRVRIPTDYSPLLDVHATEHAIGLIKEFFQTNLAFELDLMRVTAPLFVRSGTGVNDCLSGVEQPVSFSARGLGGDAVEIVQSLAKWKRAALADLGFEPGTGLYTDMNAIRPDEQLDALHSLYVDQWDWEMVITEKDRNLSFLMETVETIYDVIRRTEKYIAHTYPRIETQLPDTIAFYHSQELLDLYPGLSPAERELRACREYGAVFIIGIGGALSDGVVHDDRASDYDDWSTETEDGYQGLNGDLFVYNETLDCAFELSSMGIRVNPEGLRRQLALKDEEHKLSLPFHDRLLRGELPLCIGGGIGQSRLCMLYLRKAHIGEIQSSLWPEDIVLECRRHGIPLL